MIYSFFFFTYWYSLLIKFRMNCYLGHIQTFPCLTFSWIGVQITSYACPLLCHFTHHLLITRVTLSISSLITGENPILWSHIIIMVGVMGTFKVINSTIYSVIFQIYSDDLLYRNMYKTLKIEQKIHFQPQKSCIPVWEKCLTIKKKMLSMYTVPKIRV